MIKARVTVTLKNGVLDPQGKAIEGALGASASAASARCARARCSTSSSQASDQAKAEADLKAMCDKLLANTVIENYAVALIEVALNMKSAVVLLPGLNRDRDMIAALTKISGKAPVTVWQTDTEIPDVDLIVIPGGFSYGDYLRCGAIAARMPVMRAVAEKAAKGVQVIGVCNGFQILVEAGLLPGALMRNDLAEIRLPRGEARGRQRQHRLHPQLCAGPDHPLARLPIMTATISPIPKRWPGSRAKARWCSAMPKAPTRTARSTTSPASSTNAAMCSA